MLMMDMVASAAVIGHIAGATIVQPMATVRAASGPIIRDVIACLLLVWFCGEPWGWLLALASPMGNLWCFPLLLGYSFRNLMTSRVKLHRLIISAAFPRQHLHCLIFGNTAMRQACR